MRYFQVTVVGLAVMGMGDLSAQGAVAVFSTQSDNTIYTLDDSTGVLLQDTLWAGQSVSRAVRSNGHLLFSTNGAIGTSIVNPASPGGLAYSTYTNNLTLGISASDLTGTAIGNLEDADGIARFYRLDVAGPTLVANTPIIAGAVSDGKALISQDGVRLTYDVAANELTGIGSGVTTIAAVGNARRFASDLFEETRIVDEGFGTVDGVSGNQLKRAFGGSDVFLLNIDDGADGYGSIYDVRNGGINPLSGSGDLFAVAAGNSNYFFYSFGSGTAFYDPDDNNNDGITIGTLSTQQLVSGFSFGNYAVLGLRDGDGSGGRTIVVDDQGNVISTLAVSIGNDSAAYVNGAGVVPEPTSLALLGMGGWLLIRRRR